MQYYLGIDELAKMMMLTPSTVRRRLAKQPFDLPPKIFFSNSRILRWRQSDVECWLYEHGIGPNFITETETIMNEHGNSTLGSNY